MTSPETRFLDLPGERLLESGETLPGVRVAFRTWGRLDAHGTNGVAVCHALTGSADADDWWSGMFGPGRALDPDRDFIVCQNILGSCYGTTGPASPVPGTDRWYGPDFPGVTVRDMVALQAEVLDRLGVRRVAMVIGGSLGGMQALEWAAMYPDRVSAAVPIATSAAHSAWCIAWSEAQRQAIRADPDWKEGRYSRDRGPEAGLAAARMVAMCTYRTRESFQARFGRRFQGDDGLFAVESYLRYQGRKLVRRFDANTYVTLTRAMDSHDLGRGRGGVGEALAGIRAATLVVAIDSDVLYPPVEQRELASGIPGARLATLHSPDGHDGFLIQTEELGGMVREFRDREDRDGRRAGR
jgi:homoserine O-acetyltransferase